MYQQSEIPHYKSSHLSKQKPIITHLKTIISELKGTIHDCACCC